MVGVGGQLAAGLRHAGRSVGHARQQQAELVRQQLLAGHGVHAEGRERLHHGVVAVGQRRVGVVARLVVVVLDVQAGQLGVLDAQLATGRVDVLSVKRLRTASEGRYGKTKNDIVSNVRVEHGGERGSRTDEGGFVCSAGILSDLKFKSWSGRRMTRMTKMT